MPLRKIRDPYNFEKCRWCDHYFLSHSSMVSNKQSCGWKDLNLVEKCKCNGFAPKDNLEFLEYKYGQLGKKISN